MQRVNPIQTQCQAQIDLDCKNKLCVLSQVLNPLQTQELLETITGTVTLLDLNDRVRERLREEKASRKISERDLAAFCRWSQSKVAQKLGGHTAITLNELETLCQALGISPTEAVRDRGLEFVADLTPTELRVLEIIRRFNKQGFETFLQMVQMMTGKVLVTEHRGATPKRAKYGKPRP